MKQLIAKLNLTEPMGNKKIFKIFEYESGEVGYSLTNSDNVGFATSNLQCGWRGPLLPDNVFEYESPKQLLESVIEAVNGGVSNVDSSSLFFNNFKFKL